MRGESAGRPIPTAWIPSFSSNSVVIPSAGLSPPGVNVAVYTNEVVKEPSDCAVSNRFVFLAPLNLMLAANADFGSQS